MLMLHKRRHQELVPVRKHLGSLICRKKMNGSRKRAQLL